MDYEAFGKFLSQQRELRGMSKEEVATATRIPLSVLGALESGHVERLPGRVFVVNYIRAYATVIGLNPDDAVLRFEETDSTAKTSPPPAALERQRMQSALWKLLLAAGLLAVLVYLLLAYSGKLPAGAK